MIEQIKNAISLLDKQLSCGICENSDNLCRIKFCGHIFCFNCLKELNKCPECNIIFTKKDIHLDNTAITIRTSIDRLKVLFAANSNFSVKTQLKENNEFFNDITVNDILDCNCDQYIDSITNIPLSTFIDKKNNLGETKLHLACKKDNELNVKELIDSGASVNAQDYADWTPLHEAIVNENKNIIEMLIKNGSVVNAPGLHYETPLHKAVIQNNKEIVELLLKNGADKNLKNYEGLSALDLANSEIKQILNNTKCEFKQTLKLPSVGQYKIFMFNSTTELIQSKINEFCLTFSASVSYEINQQVTFVIADSNSKIIKLSFEFLLAILLRIPVITIEWFNCCLLEKRLINFDKYLVIGTEQLSQNAVINSLISKLQLHPKLFSCCYFHLIRKRNHRKVIFSEDEWCKLITIGGGKILKREPIPQVLTDKFHPWHAPFDSSISHCCHYILYDPKHPPELCYNMKELRHMPYHWLIQCILEYKLVPPEFILNIDYTE